MVAAVAAIEKAEIVETAEMFVLKICFSKLSIL
jgi:hypothetical protein